MNLTRTCQSGAGGVGSKKQPKGGCPADGSSSFHQPLHSALFSTGLVCTLTLLNCDRNSISLSKMALELFGEMADSRAGTEDIQGEP